MKERPILFSAPMVRAILDWSKTQTRRVMKVQPSSEGFQLLRVMSTTGPKKHEGKLHWAKLSENNLCVLDSDETHFDCPYGKVGDRLWVRETWQSVHFSFDQETGISDDWHHSEKILKYPCTYYDTVYAASTPDVCAEDRGFPWRPAIHMPRWASRINLEITGVRVERLHNISEADAAAEGFDLPPANGQGFKFRARHNFKLTWDSIYKNWDQNPWVWVVEFKRI